MPAWVPLFLQLYNTNAIKYKYIAGFAKPDRIRYIKLILKIHKGLK